MKSRFHFDEELMDGLIAHTEFIPLISKEEEDFLLSDSDIPDTLPVLPIRENVLFPGVILPIAASRAKSVQLLKMAGRQNAHIGVVTQSNEVEEPTMADLFSKGVVARVLKVFDLPNDTTMAVVQGIMKFNLLEITDETPYMHGRIALIDESDTIRNKRNFRTNITTLRKRYAALLKAKGRGQEAAAGIKNIGSDKILINYIASHMEASAYDKQQLLECPGYEDRLVALLLMMDEEMAFLHVRDEVQDKARHELDRQQREYFLNQQMRVIQDELGGNPAEQDVAALRARANDKLWNDSVAEIFEKELQKLQRYSTQSPDYSVQLNYLDLMLSLPWGEFSRDNLRIDHARKVLDRDHYGIEKVKERILEYLAVIQLKQQQSKDGTAKSPIICLVGPPGTGKTSLGKSIAAAMNRKYVRVALGGLHDEAEIRGHRRTYIGAMPGRIIQGFKKAGTSNPVFVLDEIDKVHGMSHNGDPTSALLEVLDPEQNSAFHDNYLDVDFDLSNALFIATANTLGTIQPALLDRMEVIDLSGYILEEKLEIASHYLIPRQLKEHGFRRGELKFDKEVLTAVIGDYTRESGVRQLEKTIAKIVRRKAVQKASGETFDKRVRCGELKELLGLPVHNSERRGNESKVGVVTGLAWTQVGGEILFIESSVSKGKGTLSLTGNLGDVMKESATLAFEYLKANAGRFGVDPSHIDETNLHIHVPEGATPKDGPSAGITMFVAMVSTFTNRKVRANYAMTGEITLRGAVTPVGGIREKILAAKRAGITDILLCEDNRRDVEDIKADYLQGLTFHYIREMSEALPIVLE
ncbi:MAG: ATP-dependent Lon protease [bacterium P3]|nr:MAG: ATP-dependent Lon protease [bacterium P3]KWW42631.1 MAG: ATP-dependent Lon protease [bacterium F083]